jgi:cobalt transporter subunit CbtB
MTIPTASPADPSQADESARPAPELRRRARVILPALAPAALGLMHVHGGGLAQMDALHNAAHDARHAAGFPCH